MKRQARIALSLAALLASCWIGQSLSAQEKVKFPVGVGTKTIGTNMFWLRTKRISGPDLASDFTNSGTS